MGARTRDGGATGGLFDAYVMVDWSAAARPCRGADSIWWALVVRQENETRLMQRENPTTRAAAMDQLADLIGGLADRGKRVLAGFDFPFGYPAGFARMLGVKEEPAWRGMWAMLAQHIEDGAANQNNRFACAGWLNRRLGHDGFPFWGHPHGHDYDGLKPRKAALYSDTLPERRLIDRRLPRAKTVWQLNGNGSVGGQILTGLPRLAALRADARLRGRARVWPFETADMAIDAGDIVIAEVYPSLVPHDPEPGQVKDACQVHTIGRFLAAADAEGSLAGMFHLADTLSTGEETAVRSEEGWILGVQGRA